MTDSAQLTKPPASRTATIALAALALALLAGLVLTPAASAGKPPKRVVALTLSGAVRVPEITHFPLSEAAAAHVASLSPVLEGIPAQDPDLIGQAYWWAAEESGDGWRVTSEVGWGDCPAGCIEVAAKSACDKDEEYCLAAFLLWCCALPRPSTLPVLQTCENALMADILPY